MKASHDLDALPAAFPASLDDRVLANGGPDLPTGVVVEIAVERAMGAWW